MQKLSASNMYCIPSQLCTSDALATYSAI